MRRTRHRSLGGQRIVIPELVVALVVSAASVAGVARLARGRREVCQACWKRTLIGDKARRDYRCENCGEQYRRRGVRLIRLADWDVDDGAERIPTATVVSLHKPRDKP